MVLSSSVLSDVFEFLQEMDMKKLENPRKHFKTSIFDTPKLTRESVWVLLKGDNTLKLSMHFYGHAECFTYLIKQ